MQTVLLIFQTLCLFLGLVKHHITVGYPHNRVVSYRSSIACNEFKIKNLIIGKRTHSHHLHGTDETPLARQQHMERYHTP